MDPLYDPGNHSNRSNHMKTRLYACRTMVNMLSTATFVLSAARLEILTGNYFQANFIWFKNIICCILGSIALLRNKQPSNGRLYVFSQWRLRVNNVSRAVSFIPRARLFNIVEPILQNTILQNIKVTSKFTAASLLYQKKRLLGDTENH